MRPSDYLLNPDKLEDLVGYAMTVILSLGVFALWTLIRSKEKILIKQRTG